MKSRHALAIGLALTIVLLSAPFWHVHELVFPGALLAAVVAYEAVWWGRVKPATDEYRDDGSAPPTRR